MHSASEAEDWEVCFQFQAGWKPVKKDHAVAIKQQRCTKGKNRSLGWPGEEAVKSQRPNLKTFAYGNLTQTDFEDYLWCGWFRSFCIFLWLFRNFLTNFQSETENLSKSFGVLSVLLRICSLVSSCNVLSPRESALRDETKQRLLRRLLLPLQHEFLKWFILSHQLPHFKEKGRFTDPERQQPAGKVNLVCSPITISNHMHFLGALV